MVDFKTETPDTSWPETGFIFGADSQAATAPSIYPFSAIFATLLKGRDPAVDGPKLDGIEAGATADQTGAEIKTAYEAELDTNAYTDAEKTKLAGIETGATADQTGAEIKTAYEAELDTNAYTDAEKTKLAGIAAGATVGVNAIGEVVASVRSGLDSKLITGTAGTNGNLASWNADGDAVDSGIAAAAFQNDVLNSVVRVALDADGDSWLSAPVDDKLRARVGGTDILDIVGTGIQALIADLDLSDSNGNVNARFSKVASAVNFPKFTNAATGNAVTIAPEGTDANIDLDLTAKGSGQVLLNGSSPASTGKAIAMAIVFGG